MIISLICAYGKNRAIGKDNKLLWRLSSDLKKFKELTMGHKMIMGRKTFESIGKALPGRETLIISRNESYLVEGCKTFPSIESALEYSANDEEVFIVGGAEIYKQTIENAGKLYLTEVDLSPEADAFFPESNKEKWNLVSTENHSADEKNECEYSFLVYEKI